MGAFIIFPVLMFSIFITAVLGFADFVHVSMEVHAAAQNAVQAGAEIPSTTANGGLLQSGSLNQPTGGIQHVALSSAGINATVGPMLNGKPYVTGWSCGVVGTAVKCHVHFSVSMPILGYVNGTTSASSSGTAVS